MCPGPEPNGAEDPDTGAVPSAAATPLPCLVPTARATRGQDQGAGESVAGRGEVPLHRSSL
ncbi:hypothetical protein GCM10025792_01490 [Pseudonocardia tropica]